jgi:hypothetical protein
MACPGSIGLLDRMEAQSIPTDKDSVASVMGTRAHLYSECRIKSLFYPESEREHWAAEADKVKAQLTEEMVKNAESYVSYVTGYLFGQAGGE